VSQTVLAMYGLTDRVVSLKPWRTVPACDGAAFQAFSHVKKFGRPETAPFMTPVFHPLLRYPYCIVVWKLGIVRTFPQKMASDCIQALIADRLPSEQSPLPGDVGRFDVAPMAGSPGAERHEAVSIRVLIVS